jgi:hypothetical protein
LKDRGTLRPGAWAEILVFDPAKVRDAATYLEPHQLSEGMSYVLVNGIIEKDADAWTGKLGGGASHPIVDRRHGVSIILNLLIAIAQPAMQAAALSGRVTAEGTNAPLADVRVMLFPASGQPGPMGPPPQAVTDQDGRFTFSGLTPGDYRLDARKTGYVDLIWQLLNLFELTPEGRGTSWYPRLSS